MSHFFITLPSDSSVKYFPNNTVAHFTTKLSERIRLDGDYEVGLSEIIYTNSWRYFMDDDCGITLTRKDGRSVEPLCLPSRQYKSEKDMIDELNELSSDDCFNITFTINDHDHKVKMLFDQLGSAYSGVNLSEKFRRYFGFARRDYTLGVHYSDTPFDMNAGLRLMYIYSDIASYSLVGDTKTPLLRVVNVDSSHGITARVTFSRPNYIPVARRDIETIEININNELGLPMPFEYGKSVITLHFRRRRPNFLQ